MPTGESFSRLEMMRAQTDRRRHVASLARKLLEGEMTLDAFFGQLQSEDWDDTVLAELLDLIEDEPVRSRVFGVGPRGYEEYRGRVRRLIERAETPASPEL